MGRCWNLVKRKRRRFQLTGRAPVDGDSFALSENLRGETREDDCLVPERWIAATGLLHLVAVRVPLRFGLAALHQGDDFLFTHLGSPVVA